jgi:hypothetical protein
MMRRELMFSPPTANLQNMEYINERFMLNLRGQLYPIQQHGTTYLKGQADLVVEVELPPPFLLTPRSLLETAGTSLLQSVLGTFKQRLLRQLILDYRHWVDTQIITDYGSEIPSTPVANS